MKKLNLRIAPLKEITKNGYRNFMRTRYIYIHVYYPVDIFNP